MKKLFAILGLALAMLISSPITTHAEDITPPYVEEVYPADGQMGIPGDTPIVWHAKDDGVGVNYYEIRYPKTFVVKDDTLSCRTILGELEVDGADPGDVLCTFTPDYDYHGKVTCTVTGHDYRYYPPLHDFADNEMEEDFIWIFYTEDYEDVEEATWGQIKVLDY